MLSPRLTSWLLMAPGLAWLAAFMVLPSLLIFALAFFERDVGEVLGVDERPADEGDRVAVPQPDDRPGLLPRHLREGGGCGQRAGGHVRTLQRCGRPPGRDFDPWLRPVVSGSRT